MNKKVVAAMKSDPISVIFGGIILFLGSFIGVFLMLSKNTQIALDQAFLESGVPAFMEKIFSGNLMDTAIILTALAIMIAFVAVVENFRHWRSMIEHWGFMFKHQTIMAWINVRHFAWKTVFFFRSRQG